MENIIEENKLSLRKDLYSLIWMFRKSFQNLLLLDVHKNVRVKG